MKRLFLPVLSALGLVVLGAASSYPVAADPAGVTPLPPVTETDGRAGACFSYYPNVPPDPHPYLPMAYDAGSRWDRFDFIWPSIEPRNDQWNFSAYDALVNDLYNARMNIVGILLWTPDWASTGGGMGRLSLPRFDQRPPGWYAPVPYARTLARVVGASSSPPQGLYLPWNDPGNYWGNYVYTVVSHFGDRVKHWEMWNEPEWNYFWTGTSTDYAQLLKVGYQAAKAACPDCTVLFGGLHYWANPSFYRWVLNILNDDPGAPANNYYFDVMSVHLYSRSSNVYDVVNTIRDGMLDFVPEHPIWLTETGVPVWDDASVDPDPRKYDYAATQDEAAAYVIQSYAEAWASGVERYFFFRTNDADMSEYFGLVRNDRSLRPAYVAYQVATTYMVSPTLATRVTYANGARRVTLWGTPRGKLSVLWNTTPTTVTFNYAATLPTATLVDRWGVTRTIAAMGGGYALTLPGATANTVRDANDYIIGGEPYLVIESDTTPPGATVMQPLPTTTYSHTVVISCTATDDAAGIWGYEIQMREGEAGPWTDWLFIQPTPASFTGGQHGRTYCFRARAWDKAGNPGEWPTDAQACTTIDLSREVHFSLEEVFGDGDRDGVRDEGEGAVTAHLRLQDVTGADVITPTVGSSWEFTSTLMAGDYTLVVVPQGWPSPPPGWLPGWFPIQVEAGSGVFELPLRVGLLPHQSSLYLPLALQGW